LLASFAQQQKAYLKAMQSVSLPVAIVFTRMNEYQSDKAANSIITSGVALCGPKAAGATQRKLMT
jgi:hypothetical protein